MAKSARSSSKKRNHANLRTKVFGPAHDARLERLSAKLQEIANTPTAGQDKKAEIEGTEKDNKTTETSADIDADAMQWTGLAPGAKSNTTFKKTKSTRVSKTARRKPRNQVVFPSEMARRKRQLDAKSRK